MNKLTKTMKKKCAVGVDLCHAAQHENSGVILRYG